MRSCRVVRASDCQCQSRNSPGFTPNPNPTQWNVRGGRWSSVEWRMYFQTSILAELPDIHPSRTSRHPTELPDIQTSRNSRHSYVQSMQGMHISRQFTISYADIQSSHACKHADNQSNQAWSPVKAVIHADIQNSQSIYTCTTARYRTFLAARHSDIPAMHIDIPRRRHAAMQSCQVFIRSSSQTCWHFRAAGQAALQCSATRYADCRRSNQLDILTFQSS
jgi:hypothetical protein